MATHSNAPAANDRVLATLNQDGSRRWIRPKLSTGIWHRRRMIVAWALIAIFTLLPWIKINGKPAILLDLPARHFTFFGATLLATDTIVLMFFMVSVLVSVFLLTALFGRVWCGWGCPQTVYMEFVFRPIERWIEGGTNNSLKMDEGKISTTRRKLKYIIYFFISIFLAHTFLAYFVGVDRLWVWIRSSPFEHPAGFFVMAAVTALMMWDFSFFREQTCLVACPYGRFQSALLDAQSLIVGYDPNRGERRGTKGDRRKAVEGGEVEQEKVEDVFGDCIDCYACVATCPTGIDIRDGLQMECIHCTQCMDACDSIMEKTGRPKGLIRYTSKDELAKRPKKFLRPRVIIYPVIFLIMFTGLVINLASISNADVTILRGIGSPFTLTNDGMVTNQVRVKITNRGDEATPFTIAPEGLPEGAKFIAPQNPFTVEAGATATTSVFMTLPKDAFTGGVREIEMTVTADGGYKSTNHYRLLGPKPEDEEQDE
ncbi:MAG: cytochrome c oxidase accessory protein CcoG [Deltaproteobacteria bacterium]|nr:cytochrome c oxidase accessory protein CcoG [bacterium]MCB9487340.1 cytochrome c oxidase accessory protein CcoG [Deltaproteobacteria bacterium]